MLGILYSAMTPSAKMNVDVNSSGETLDGIG